MAITLDLESMDLAVGADMPEHTRGDFDGDDDLGRHHYCKGCDHAWVCHRMGRCALELEARGR